VTLRAAAGKMLSPNGDGSPSGRRHEIGSTELQQQRLNARMLCKNSCTGNICIDAQKMKDNHFLQLMELCFSSICQGPELGIGWAEGLRESCRAA